MYVMKNKLNTTIVKFLFVCFILFIFTSCEQKVESIIFTKDYTLTDTNRIITWHLPGVAEINYHLQVAENYTFTKLIIEEHELKAPEYRIATEKLVPNKKYYWRVLPKAQGGIWSQPKELIFARPVPDTIQNTKVNEAQIQ